MKPCHPYITLPLDEGLIVARHDGHRLFVMNGSARFMWERRAEGVADSEIPRLMAMHFGIAYEQAQHDFRKTLRRWQAVGLATPAGYYHHHEIGGVAFSVHYQDIALQAAIAPTFAHLKAATPLFGVGQPHREFQVGAEDNRFVLRADGAEILQSAILDEVLERLIRAVVMCACDHVQWLVLMHAAAVGSRTGCVLMPGVSGSGKSTLTASLLSSGRSYYMTDDVALLDRASLCVVPVPGALILKRGSWELLEPLLPELSALAIRCRAGQDVRYWAPPAAQIATVQLPVKAIIFVRYENGRKASLVPLSTLEGLSQIIEAPSAISAPITSETLEQLASWAQGIPFYTLGYGSLTEATHLIEELLWP
jgi:hypothetical protein